MGLTELPYAAPKVSQRFSSCWKSCQDVEYNPFVLLIEQIMEIRYLRLLQQKF